MTTPQIPAKSPNLVPIFSPLENCHKRNRTVMKNKYTITPNKNYSPYNFIKRNISLS
jgi:hypothetical protein